MHFVYRNYIHGLIQRGVFQEYDKIKDVPVKSKYGADILLTHRGVDMCIRCVYSEEELTEPYIMALYEAKESYGCQELYLITNTICTENACAIAEKKHIKIKENLPLPVDSREKTKYERNYIIKNYSDTKCNSVYVRQNPDTLTVREQREGKTVEQIMIDYQKNNGDYSVNVITINRVRIAKSIKWGIVSAVLVLLLIFVNPSENTDTAQAKQLAGDNGVSLVEKFI